MFENPDGYIELVFGKEPIYLGNGWSIYPHIHPTQVNITLLIQYVIVQYLLDL